MSSIRDAIVAHSSDEVLFLGSSDGEFDAAIIGTTDRNGHTVLVYDTSRIIERLSEMGMSDDEAWEWFSFNIEGAHMGVCSPIYVTPISLIV